MRNARYLAELTKFRLVAPGTFFVALKQLLDDFTHHNVDAACAMVETAGRMLIRMPETKVWRSISDSRIVGNVYYVY